MAAEGLGGITKAFAPAQGQFAILSRMVYFHAMLGDRQGPQDFLRQALKAREGNYVPAVEIAAAHAGLRDRKQTLVWLNQALEDRSIQLVFQNVDSRYRWLRGDPKFRSILVRLDLRAPATSVTDLRRYRGTSRMLGGGAVHADQPSSVERSGERSG